MENRALAAELSSLLVKERERLAKRIAAIDELIGAGRAMDTLPSAPIEPDMRFPELVHSILRGRELNASQVAQEIQRIGHKSRTRNLVSYVRVTLATHPHLYTRVSRGMYTAKEGA